jgi:hypothetical protein
VFNVGCVKIKYKITTGVGETLYSSTFEPNYIFLKIFYVYILLDMEEETFSCHTPFTSDINLKFDSTLL